MPRRLQVGDPAPDFTLPQLDGDPVSLRDYQGRALILLFTRWLG